MNAEQKGNTMKQYATIRLSNLELVKQAKSKAALEGITLLAAVEKALEDYVMRVKDSAWEEVLEDMKAIALNCGSCVDNDDHRRVQKIGMIATKYAYILSQSKTICAYMDYN